MVIFSKALVTKAAWAVGTLAVLELIGFTAGTVLAWYLAVPLIGAFGAAAAYLLDEKL